MGESKGSNGPAAPRYRREVVLASILAGLVLVTVGVVAFPRVLKRLIPPTPAAGASPARAAPLGRLPERPQGPNITRDPLLFNGRHTNFILASAISADDKLFASGAEGVVKLWDVTTGAELRSIGATAQGKIAGLHFFADEKRLLSGGGRTLKTWDVATGAEMSSVDVGHAMFALAVTKDEKTAFTGGADGSVVVCDLATSTTKTFSVGQAIYALALSPDGTRLAVGTKSGTVSIYAVPSNDLVLSWRPHAQVIDALDFSPDGSTIATASDDRRVAVTAIGAAGKKTALDSEYVLGDEAWGATFSPDGKLLALTGKDKTMNLVSVPARWKVETNGMNAVTTRAVFSHDGTRLVVAAGGMLASFPVARHGSGTAVPEPAPGAAGEPTPRNDDERRFLEIMRLSRQWPRVEISAIEAKVKEALTKNPNAAYPWIANAQLELRKAYRNGDDYEPTHVRAARDNLDRAAGLGAKTADWWALKAWVERAAKDRPAAREAIREAYRISPHEPYAALCEARLDETEAKHAVAIASLEAIIRGTKRDDILGWAYAQLAQAHGAAGDLDGADAAHRRLVALDPANAFAHGNYASFLTDAGDYEKAIAEGNAALAIRDYPMVRNTLSRAHSLYGDELLWMQQSEERALAEYNEATSLNPRNGAPFYGRAAVTRARAVAKQVKMPPEARSDLEHAIALEPEWTQAKVALSELQSYDPQ